MEAGKLLAVAAPFSLDEILGECADALAIAAFPKGLGVSLRRDPAIPDSLVGDGSLLRHALLNLLDNAVKFTESGRVRIEASLREKSDCPGCGAIVEFEVSDTGIGMPKDKIGLAFDRFIQLDPSKSRKAGGTGLGLAIVAKSVELMGGDISVESEKGSGTRFTLRVPFEPGPAESPGRRERERFAAGEAALAGFDEEAFSDAALALSRLGLSAVKADSLQQAASLSKGFVIADELLLAEVREELVQSLDSRLVIATRLGGDARARFGGRGIAFSPVPLRSSGMRRAFSALAESALAGSGTTDPGKERL
jgi:hypothetical protein